MVIYGIVGRPGARLGTAKSTVLTWLALTYEAKFGQVIRANYHIKRPNAIFIKHPRELLNVYNSFIAIDDIYRWLGFENMRAKKFSKLMAGEIRHHNNNLAWVSSRLKEYTHKSIRDHTNYFIFPLLHKPQNIVTLDVLNAAGEQIYGVLPNSIPANIVMKTWTFYNHREDVEVTDYF